MRIFTGVANWARTPPMLLPVEPLPWLGFALEHEHVGASGFGKVIRDAGANDSAADHHHIRRTIHGHLTTILTSLSGTTITLTTCLPARSGWIFESASASLSSSSVGVPRATLSLPRSLPFT